MMIPGASRGRVTFVRVATVSREKTLAASIRAGSMARIWTYRMIAANAANREREANAGIKNVPYRTGMAGLFQSEMMPIPISGAGTATGRRISPHQSDPRTPGSKSSRLRTMARGIPMAMTQATIKGESPISWAEKASADDNFDQDPVAYTRPEKTTTT